MTLNTKKIPALIIMAGMMALCATLHSAAASGQAANAAPQTNTSIPASVPAPKPCLLYTSPVERHQQDSGFWNIVLQRFEIHFREPTQMLSQYCSCPAALTLRD